MGSTRRERVDSWLAAGGVVLAASERAARALMADFQAARLAEGRFAWQTPAIFSWDGWVREEWQERNRAGAMLLNPLQEQALWARVIRQSRADLLHPARLAEAAMRAHRLLAAYAPGALRASARAGWTGDAAVFSAWVEEFEGRCRREGLVSGSRVVVELTDSLRGEVSVASRAPLLLVGFDRVLETQKTLLNAWGVWERFSLAESAAEAEFQAAPDGAGEIAGCVGWLRGRLDANPDAKLMVVVTNLEARRGELERAFLDAGFDFEFSMGVPLGRMGLARAAVLLLRWIEEPIGEAELDWLIGVGAMAASAEEEIALAATMRQIRRDGQERMQWGMAEFAANAPERGADGWAERLLKARELLRAEPERRSPLDWVGVAERLLEALGWPGYRPLSSLGFQARDRWQRVLEEVGSLGFDGSRVGWVEFVAMLADAVAGTIFAAESHDAAVQITGPLESAGQLADGIWFLGADEGSWPGRGEPDSLLPIGLQREMEMPHASPQADWALAAEVMERLLASAGEVVFSYAKQAGGVEARPSRLVQLRIGEPLPMAAGFGVERGDRTETFEDWTAIPFPLEARAGGARTLTLQSLCPFQAFATVRLGAEDWEPAEAGLNARQRGLLLHAVLHRLWSGPENGGLRSHAELLAVPSLLEFVRGIVDRAMAEQFETGFRGRRSSPFRRFPKRYLELEAERLTGLVTEWLEYERRRMPFTVVATEEKRTVTIGGLTLRVKLDRVDRLADGSRLVIDYKTGTVGPRAWEGERPDDVQLPLYATFAMQETPETLEGLVFARVRPGETQFAGRVRDANANLLGELSGRSDLAQNPLDDRQLEEWRERIERLAEDFLAGRAVVDPKEPRITCKSCHLHAVCRIRERVALLEDEGEEEGDDGGGDD